ncbi:HPS6 protein, partial [Atractosteus spatula]|nr:HPS6 protein [Atractosteus spatula]
MKHLALDQLADLGEFTGGGDLTEYLKQSNMKSCNWSALRDIRISPDGQHIHVILHKPKGGLMTFDRLQRTHQLQNHKHLDVGSGTSVKIVDLVYLGQRDKDGGSSDLAVVQENGGVEFWRYEECKAGWERNVPHLLTESGLFVAKQRERDSSPKTPGHSESISPESLLVEAVFEEACKYYQRRSLSSTQLTVEKLKSGGMFQAPIALSSILKGYLKTQKTSERILGGTSGTYTKLLSSLDAELKSLVALEELKSLLVKASETELALHCENLVSEEVSRLLCTELDRENLLYLNVIFSTFPLESWQALQMALQLRSYEEGSLSAKAAPEVWKTVLSPVPAAHATLPNGQQCPPANGAVPAFELICRSLFRFQPRWLPRFVELAQQQQAGISSWNYGAKDSPDSPPLYKRALAVLPEKAEYQEVEVELLLCSQRPNAIMQALRLLMQLGKWGRVAQVAERFCQQSPLLNKEIFTTLLGEVSQHRDLDPYLDLLWTLCPEDLTVTSILNIVLKNLSPSAPERGPFQTDGSQLTVGLLKPLLSKVLQRETKPSQRYADILQSPSFPPPTPPRQVKGPPRAVTEPAMDYQDPRPRTPPVTPVTTASPS